MTAAPARYRVEHESRYAYTAPVSQSWQLARLTPRTLPWQTLLSHTLQVEPQADERHDARDSFGNTVTHFGLHGAQRVLRVDMQCTVDVAERLPLPRGAATSWEEVREGIRTRRHGDVIEAARQYAAASLTPGRDWLQALLDLTHRIHRDFEFDPGSTTVSTSVDEVLQLRSGVCQDFAHLMLAALRGHGLPARYVSGYLLTDPPPGQPRLMGADATHAWVAAYAPGCGWVEFDPTNDQLADARYITLAWGSDFADVAPLRGVILGGGEQSLHTAVSVLPLA